MNLVDSPIYNASFDTFRVKIDEFIFSQKFNFSFLAWMGDLAGVELDEGEVLNFEFIVGKIFVPLSYLMGVPSEDVNQVAKLVGIKTVVNEFVAFQELGVLKKTGAISKRSVVIATYALCGFANPGSIGIQLGGLGAIAPDRKKDLAQLVGRAFITGCFTSFMNACVAGALISTK